MYVCILTDRRTFVFQRIFCGSSQSNWGQNGVDMATLKSL